MAFDMDQEMDKLAELVALRAHRKLGNSRKLRLVGDSEPDEDRRPPVGAAEPVCLPDWTSFAAIDVSSRARTMHAIMVIANTYGWQIAITHFLITKGVPYLSDLTDPQLEDLLDRMHGYVDAAETGSSLPDCLPAN
jgi:hypothetical protein